MKTVENVSPKGFGENLERIETPALQGSVDGHQDGLDCSSIPQFSKYSVTPVA